MLSIDHVAVAVLDLERAAGELQRRTGLAATTRLEQAAWGTAALIVPLRQGFLELIAVTAPLAAARSLIGSRIGAVAARGGGVVAWALAPPVIEEFAASRGLVVQKGMRAAADGGAAEYSWQMAGVVQAFFSDLPLTISWDSGGVNPHTAAAVRAGLGVDGRFTTIDVDADPVALEVWLGDEPRDFALRRTSHGGRRCAAIIQAGADEVWVP